MMPRENHPHCEIRLAELHPETDLFAALLGLPTPSYAHIPIVVNELGQKSASSVLPSDRPQKRPSCWSRAAVSWHDTSAYPYWAAPAALVAWVPHWTYSACPLAKMTR